MSMAGMTPEQQQAAAAAAAAAMKASNIETFTLLALATIFVALRVWSRAITVGFKKFQVDDYLMLVALALYGFESGLSHVVGAWYHGLANSGMTTEQRRTLEPGSPEYEMRVGGSKVQIIGWNTYSLLLWTLKMCMCIFYGRLTQGLGDAMKLRIRIGYGAIIATYLIVLFSILFACRPLHRSWQIYPDPGNVCQPGISKVNCLVVVVLNVITDLYLLSIPLPLMWKAQLPTKQKIMMLFMFSGGFFVIACGILRASLILIDPVNGAAQAGAWAVRETFVAVIIGNLPMVYKLFRLWTKDVTTTIREQTGRSRTGALALSGDDGTNKSHGKAMYYSSGANSGQNSRVSRKAKKFLHPLSLRNTTVSESQEDLQMESMSTIKEYGCVVSTELSVEEQDRAKQGTPTRAGPPPQYSPRQSHMDRDPGFIYMGPPEKGGTTTATIDEDAESGSSSSSNDRGRYGPTRR